jgi:hypothetical protein
MRNLHPSFGVGNSRTPWIWELPAWSQCRYILGESEELGFLMKGENQAVRVTWQHENHCLVDRSSEYGGAEDPIGGSSNTAPQHSAQGPRDLTVSGAVLRPRRLNLV